MCGKYTIILNSENKVNADALCGLLQNVAGHCDGCELQADVMPAVGYVDNDNAELGDLRVKDGIIIDSDDNLNPVFSQLFKNYGWK